MTFPFCKCRNCCQLQQLDTIWQSSRRRLVSFISSFFFYFQVFYTFYVASFILFTLFFAPVQRGGGQHVVSVRSFRFADHTAAIKEEKEGSLSLFLALLVAEGNSLYFI